MERSLSWSRCLDDDTLTAFLVSQRALILFRGGRVDEAERGFGRALSHLAETGIDSIRILLNRGALYVEVGDLVRARADLERGVRESRRLGYEQFERIALHNLGCLEFTAGDLPAALRLIHQGIEMDGDTQQGIAYLDRSRVLLAAGLTDEADQSLAKAAELIRRDRCWQDLGEVDLTRGEVALVSGRYADARRLAGRARDRFRRHGNERWRRAAELVLLHADLRAGRPPRRLLPPARRLADEFEAAGFPLQSRTALLLAAELELRVDDDDAADALLERAGPSAARDPIGLRLHTRLVTADRWEKRDQIRKVRRVIARGLTDLATYQAQFGGIDLQSASAVHGVRLVARDLGLAMRTGQPGPVLAAVERSRAVSSRIRPVTPPADERTAELLADLRRQMDSSESAPGGGRPDPRRGQIADLQAELQSRAWLHQGSRAWRPPTTVPDLRAAAAGDGWDLVAVAELGGQLAAVSVVAGGRMRLVSLGASDAVRAWQRRIGADLDALAHPGLPATLVAAASSSLRHGAVELGRMLAAAIPDTGRRVVISPPGWLLSLPWSLLPPLVGRPLVVTPSLSGWHRGRLDQSVNDGTVTPRPGSVAVVAGPGLARAAEEAAAVASIWDGHVIVRHLPVASPSELSAAMGSTGVVHVAAHGVHRGENPMFSSLTMTGGPLFAYELDQRGTVPEHVILSACEVGRSTVRAR
ncbi:MAG: CHAT domain-containing protein, partial [Microlunatus sp.]|nr:CHAT domain-containing protein [Microlunatus sp.]